jgi:hypothetical protein
MFQLRIWIRATDVDLAIYVDEGLREVEETYHLDK